MRIQLLDVVLSGPNKGRSFGVVPLLDLLFLFFLPVFFRTNLLRVFVTCNLDAMLLTPAKNSKAVGD